jgi:hypothetical protein
MSAVAQGEQTVNKSIIQRTGKLIVAMVAFGIVFAAGAWAQCGLSAISKPSAAWPENDSQPAVAASEAPAESALASPKDSTAPIIGLWRVTFVSGGQVVDQGFDQWNFGGTEILNDTPPPATGNVCLGVWVQTGPRTFKLKHPSWTFDNSGNLNGTAIIREQVTVDGGGDNFSGPFTIDIYDLSNNLLLHLSGQITGKRITVD